jgi:hypothetical protein
LLVTVSEFQMRLLILALGTSLVLTACKNNNHNDPPANVDENLTAESIVSNDVTAIDAVTGDAANMAADVDYTAEVADNLANEDDDTTATTNSSSRTRSPRPAPSRPPETKPAPTEPAANATE